MVAVVPAAHPTQPLVDPFGRAITYLRLSVTDRCDLRCRYCMPERMTFLPRADVLTFEELEAIAAAFIRAGTRRIRLTGGEPLVRRGVMALVASLGAHVAAGRLSELTLTTNGTQLAAHAVALAAAGVRRVNVSLDTLDRARFAHIARRDALGDVLAGIAAARAAGLSVKLNMVALAGLNEDEVEPMLAFAQANGCDLTLIEAMPMGAIDEDRSGHHLPLTVVRARLEARHTLIALAERTGGPARYFRVADTGQKLGLITPLTQNFCEGCNRVRLTATGTLYPCLGQAEASDLRAVVRARPGDAAALDTALAAAVARKPRGHDFTIRPGAPPALARHMSVTGG